MSLIKNEEFSQIIRDLHWALKKLKLHQASNHHRNALSEVNAMERKIWQLQQILRDDA